MSEPLVSIIIPVYNTGRSAMDLVDSLLNGTYSNLDIILIDDGSTDDSLALLKTLKSSKVRIFSQKNAGPSGARNAGLAKAKGDYISFIDSDDSVAPSYIKSLVGSISKAHVALAVSPYLHRRLSDGSETTVGLDAPSQSFGEPRTTYVLKLFLHGSPIYAVNNKLFDAKIIRQHHLQFDETLNFAEDTKFLLDYLKYKEGIIVFLRDPLYIYNFGTNTSVVRDSNSDWVKWRIAYQNLRHWVGHPSLKDRTLLALIHSRWRIACLRSKKEAHA